jgi:hypothetical protein
MMPAMFLYQKMQLPAGKLTNRSASAILTWYVKKTATAIRI